jgi:hypothetical protein
MQDKLAKALHFIWPHQAISEEAAQQIAKQAIERAGEGSGADYAYRVASIAQALKQKHVDGVK